MRVLFMRWKYKWDSIMRKMLFGAAEFCLLSASSKLPFIRGWGTGRWEQWFRDSETIYCLGNIKIWSLSIHRAVDSPFTLLGILFPEKEVQNLSQGTECTIRREHDALLFVIMTVVQIRSYQRKKSSHFSFPRIVFSSLSTVSLPQYLLANALSKLEYLGKTVQPEHCTFWL